MEIVDQTIAKALRQRRAARHGGWINGCCSHLLLFGILSDGTREGSVIGNKQWNATTDTTKRNAIRATLLLNGRHMHLDHHGRHLDMLSCLY